MKVISYITEGQKMLEETTQEFKETVRQRNQMRPPATSRDVFKLKYNTKPSLLRMCNLTTSREKVFQEVLHTPGVTTQQIAKKLSLSLRAVQSHLHLLKQFGLVTSKRTRNVVYYFVNEQFAKGGEAKEQEEGKMYETVGELISALGSADKNNLVYIAIAGQKELLRVYEVVIETQLPDRKCARVLIKCS